MTNSLICDLISDLIIALVLDVESVPRKCKLLIAYPTKKVQTCLKYQFICTPHNKTVVFYLYY